MSEDLGLCSLQKRRKTKDDVTPSQRARMKEVFVNCMQAVMDCVDVDGRKRCEMFKELPSRKARLLPGPGILPTDC